MQLLSVLFQQQAGRYEQHRNCDRQGNQVALQIDEAEPLRKRATRDRDEERRREHLADQAAAAGYRCDRVDQSRVVHGGDHRHDRSGENGRHLAAHEGGDEQADAGRYGHVE
jgi:hypothetical protein